MSAMTTAKLAEPPTAVELDLLNRAIGFTTGGIEAVPPRLLAAEPAGADPTIVSLGDLSTVPPGHPIIIPADVYQRFRDDIRTAVIAGNLVALSTALECARDAVCVLSGVVSPGIEVVVNREAAARTGVDFQPAFLIMVVEI